MSATRLSAMVMLFATAAGVTCGCAVGPNYHKPAAPAGAGYAPAPLPEASASAAIHGGEVQHFVSGRDISFEWWELFQSPALNSLIDKAFKANPTITAAQAALVHADIVREFLKANGVTTAESSSDAKASVVRVICVRK